MSIPTPLILGALDVFSIVATSQNPYTTGLCNPGVWQIEISNVGLTLQNPLFPQVPDAVDVAYIRDEIPGETDSQLAYDTAQNIGGQNNRTAASWFEFSSPAQFSNRTNTADLPVFPAGGAASIKWTGSGGVILSQTESRVNAAFPSGVRFRIYSSMECTISGVRVFP